MNPGPSADRPLAPGPDAAAPLACDICIVGGGINGAGIARDAAGRGLRVVLAEQHDLAAHTSSASTKLIHGGLRYLEYREFALVRKALQEREVLLRSAPHIMWPLRFVLPHDAAAHRLRPAWLIRLGLFLYDHMARREVLPASTGVDLRSHATGVPLKSHYTRGFIYSDGWVDDARLTVLCALDARERGARVLTRTRCVAAQRGASHWQVSLLARDGTRTAVQARALVNAAGPWAEAFLRQVAQPAHGEALATHSLRLVKGSHIVVPRLFEHDHAYIFQNPDRRVIFAIPYEQRFTLVGTTDEEVTGDPGDARITADEIAYLCEQASRYFKQPLRPQQVVWSYSGVRPLLGGELGDSSGSASAVTRDYLLEANTTAAPLLSVWGGKITTFRKLAETATDTLCRLLNVPARAWTHDASLPGGDLSAWIGAPTRPDQDFARFVPEVLRRHAWLTEPLAHRWARAYGSRIDRVLGAARSVADLGVQVAPGLFEAELQHLCDQEWALEAPDVLWRRSKLGLHYTPAQRDAVAQWLDARAA